MFYSRSIDETKIDLFLNLLERLAAGLPVVEKPAIDSVIRDAQGLAVGSKNFYDIDRDGYLVATNLFEGDKTFFAKLDIDNISSEDYKKIAEILMHNSTETA